MPPGGRKTLTVDLASHFAGILNLTGEAKKGAYQLLCHLPSETGFYPTLDINLGQILVFEGAVLAELLALAGEVSLLGIGLRTDRYIFT